MIYVLVIAWNQDIRLTLSLHLATGNNTGMLRYAAYCTEDRLGSCGRRPLFADGKAHMLVFCHFAASQVGWPWEDYISNANA